MLRIPRCVFERIIAHARAEAPLEACGFLVGRDREVVRHLRLTNADRSPDHFTLDPREQFAAARLLRADGLESLAVYHSHPVSPPQPSAEDIRLAFDPTIRHLIVSLAGTRPEARAYRIHDGAVAAEPFEIAAESAATEYDEFAVLSRPA